MTFLKLLVGALVALRKQFYSRLRLFNIIALYLFIIKNTWFDSDPRSYKNRRHVYIYSIYIYGFEKKEALKIRGPEAPGRFEPCELAMVCIV